MSDESSGLHAFQKERLGLSQLNQQDLVLCATSRLARELRGEYDRLQQGAGRRQWPTLPAMTLAQWLDARLEEASLLGRMQEARMLPPFPLSGMQERVLWQTVIEACSRDQEASALFDLPGMAEVAADAHAMMVAWPACATGWAQAGSEESRQFLKWQAAFQKRCEQEGWLDAARFFDWQLDRLAEGAVAKERLPRRLLLAGFDRYKPQELRLVEILQVLGVEVIELAQGWTQSAAETGRVQIGAGADRRAECTMAVAWVQDWLARKPDARLGIVVPEMAELRNFLADRLDEVLAVETLRPSRAEAPRCYNFTLGTALSGQPLVVSALRLLRMVAGAQRIRMEDFTIFLRDPYTSDGLGEADACALMDAAMRRHLPASFSLEQAISFIRSRSTRLPRLIQHLDAIHACSAAFARKQTAGEWARVFPDLLKQGGWPGMRVLSSHEYQARQRFEEALLQLAELDVVLGPMRLSEALGHLSKICREQIFQPQTEGEPAIQIMGLLESSGTLLDGLWVMGMNDHLWPPAARPNPLIPAEAQRRAGVPNASAQVQADFAAVVHRRLLRSAAEVVFSYAQGEGDRALRPSPLIQPELPMEGACRAEERLSAREQAGLPGRLMEDEAQRFERFIDRSGPPLGEHESLRGGTALLKAQAICPAWAFYRYRLGARALEMPEEGLDEAQRGTLLHRAMQCFWEKKDGLDSGVGSLQALKALSEAELEAMIATAVAQAIERMQTEMGAQSLGPPRFVANETLRLQALLKEWLLLERERATDFTVVACEEERKLTIEGIEVRLVVDRIDRLNTEAGVQEGPQWLILDYKTGSQLSARTWAEDRIREPQLPIYAAFQPDEAGQDARMGNAMEATKATEEVVAVAFARVRPQDCRFIGIAVSGEVLPGVMGIDEESARKVFESITDWPALLAHWRKCISAMALEIREGEAAVSFEDEADLQYCEVKPLLRLPEYRAQRMLAEGQS